MSVYVLDYFLAKLRNLFVALWGCQATRRLHEVSAPSKLIDLSNAYFIDKGWDSNLTFITQIWKWNNPFRIPVTLVKDQLHDNSCFFIRYYRNNVQEFVSWKSSYFSVDFMVLRTCKLDYTQDCYTKEHVGKIWMWIVRWIIYQRKITTSASYSN